MFGEGKNGVAESDLNHECLFKEQLFCHGLCTVCKLLLHTLHLDFFSGFLKSSFLAHGPSCKIKLTIETFKEEGFSQAVTDSTNSN